MPLGDILVITDDNAATIERRLDGYDAETRAFLPELEARGIVEVLPISVGDDEAVDDGHLKKLRGEVYRVETADGTTTRMLNLDGMRDRLYRFLAEKFQ